MAECKYGMVLAAEATGACHHAAGLMRHSAVAVCEYGRVTATKAAEGVKGRRWKEILNLKIAIIFRIQNSEKSQSEHTAHYGNVTTQQIIRIHDIWNSEFENSGISLL